jgi:hypothetical protein
MLIFARKRNFLPENGRKPGFETLTSGKNRSGARFLGARHFFSFACVEFQAPLECGTEYLALAGAEVVSPGGFSVNLTACFVLLGCCLV